MHAPYQGVGRMVTGNIEEAAARGGEAVLACMCVIVCIWSTDEGNARVDARSTRYLQVGEDVADRHGRTAGWCGH